MARWLGVAPEEVLDLSASLNPFAPDLAAMVRQHADAIGRYGDISGGEKRLAATMGVDPDHLVLTNGGSEAIALVAEHLGRGWVEEPEFSLYQRHLREVTRGAPRWRSNPHSPSGRLADADEHAAVWDEAYWPLATGTWTRGDHHRGAIVLGSLTKLWACPGLRLGYILTGEPSLAEGLRQRRPRWAVGALALAVLHSALPETDLEATAARVAAARQRLVEELQTRGFETQVGSAPWVLVPGAAGLREALARHGVVVRDCTSFGWPNTVRIGIPDSAGLHRLTDALDRAREERS